MSSNQFSEDSEADGQTVQQMLDALATGLAASINTMVRINNHIAALRSELQDARKVIDAIDARLEANDRIERESL